MPGDEAMPLGRLAAMVCKHGVALGGLTDDDRRLALALVWRGLPEAPLAEREVNEALKQQLAGAASFIATDHVELRRWLVDTGWFERDGYGREYRRVALAALAEPLHKLAATLSEIDPERWCDEQRKTRADARAARHRAWLDRQRA